MHAVCFFEIYSNIARDIAAPSSGSVPDPNSSNNTSELESILFKISDIFLIWAPYVEKPCSKLCSVEISQ